jgi:hypothetical protein
VLTLTHDYPRHPVVFIAFRLRLIVDIGVAETFRESVHALTVRFVQVPRIPHTSSQQQQTPCQQGLHELRVIQTSTVAPMMLRASDNRAGPRRQGLEASDRRWYSTLTAMMTLPSVLAVGPHQARG